MRIVVTGMGPRSGTSAMMRLLIQSGYAPIGEAFPTYVVPEENPKGYWDLDWETLTSQEMIHIGDNQCGKVFPPHLHRIDWSTIDCLIVMYRADFNAQQESCKRVGEKEGIHFGDGWLKHYQEEARLKILKLMQEGVKVVYVEMESFRLMGEVCRIPI